MSQQDKSKFYQALKSAGVELSKTYAQYSEAELAAGYAKLQEGLREQQAFIEQQRLANPVDPPVEWPQEFKVPDPAPEPEAPVATVHELNRSLNDWSDNPAVLKALEGFPGIPVTPKLEGEMAGERLNALAENEPIRIDPVTGHIWFQEEVPKPAVAKPRGRRVLQYTDEGTHQETIQDGKYTETFEVAGGRAPTTGMIKVTLPSYQTGLYLNPSFPWRVHCYNGQEGFDLFEVQNFYGGETLVPPECKTKYVANVLCYDMRSVVNAVETENRRLQLAAAGRINL